MLKNVLKVKFNIRSVSIRVVPILRLLSAGNYPTKIGGVLGMSRPHES